MFFAGRGRTGERNAGSRGFAFIAERHGLNVDSGAPRIRDVVHLAVDVRTGVVPRTEDRGDGFDQLNIGISREVFIERLLVVVFVFGNQTFEVGGIQISIRFVAFGFFQVFKHLVHLNTGMAFGNVREHQDETAVAVERKAFIAGFFG